MEDSFVIYTSSTCIYCDKAKKLLENKGHTFREIDITDDPEAREALVVKTGGRRTVPQIFMNESHIGGYQDLVCFFDGASLRS